MDYQEAHKTFVIKYLSQGNRPGLVSFGRGTKQFFQVSSYQAKTVQNAWAVAQALAKDLDQGLPEASLRERRQELLSTL